MYSKLPYSSSSSGIGMPLRFSEVQVFKKRRRLRKQLHEELYAQIPNMTCLSGCADCCGCCGILRFSRYEVAQISTAKIIRAIFRRFRQVTSQKCPHLTADNRCGIYEVRPFVCRLFATTERLPCPKGIGPDKLLSAEEAEKLINQFLRIIDLWRGYPRKKIIMSRLKSQRFTALA